MEHITVDRGRTKKLLVGLGYDVSDDVITSEIRLDIDPTSELIATWNVAFVTDGVDGELVLTLDDSVTSGITKTTGYMDLKRVTNGEPLSAFDEPVQVVFQDVVTA